MKIINLRRSVLKVALSVEGRKQCAMRNGHCAYCLVSRKNGYETLNKKNGIINKRFPAERIHSYALGGRTRRVEDKI